jgi:DNA recombination protein RmuC
MQNMILIILLSISLLVNIVILIKLLLRKQSDGSVYFEIIKDFLGAQRKQLKDEMGYTRKQNTEENASMRKEMINLFSEFNIANIKSINEISKSNSERLDRLRITVDGSLKNIQQSNDKKLDEMRKTVDEKLSETLEKRLVSSFETVSKQLKQVYESMGEVKTLANGVGDLKNVLSNVKARGGWGEVQLEILLEDMLTKKQFIKNFKVGSGTVEFAIKMPGRQDDPVYLPIDSKFPMEDYSRLIAAQKAGSMEGMEQSRKKLYNRFRDEGKKIGEKYIDPPQTTEFAIMFLPVEGLYAEAIQAGLLEELQTKHRVVITGPATLSALLNSLQMGFKTLAIEKRSAEVWNLLGAIKKGFSNFTVALDKTRNTLKTAQGHLEDASTKTRTIESKLRKVEILEDSAEQIEIEEK